MEACRGGPVSSSTILQLIFFPGLSSVTLFSADIGGNFSAVGGFSFFGGNNFGGNFSVVGSFSFFGSNDFGGGGKNKI